METLATVYEDFYGEIIETEIFVELEDPHESD